MTIRAKMYLEATVPNTWGGSQAVFRCQYDTSLPEDQKFQKATPTGDARFSIDNPPALDQLVVGGTYYFDISPCDERSNGQLHPRKRASDWDVANPPVGNAAETVTVTSVRHAGGYVTTSTPAKAVEA